MPRILADPHHGLIVVQWIVVEQHQVFRARLPGQEHGIFPGAVSPSAMRFVLGGRILRIADEDIRVLRVLAKCVVRLLYAMLIVGCINDHRAVRFNTVTGRALRMVQRKGAHL